MSNVKNMNTTKHESARVAQGNAKNLNETDFSFFKLDEDI